MDAFSVSLVNGMHEVGMTRRRGVCIAAVYGFFQALMPMLGWLCAHTVVMLFSAVRQWIPWISLILLLVIGGAMICNEGNDSDEPIHHLTPQLLILQGIATSVDALSVGFTIAEYGFFMALLCSMIIAGITLFICVIGVELGKKVGNRLAERAACFGGILLILIGIEIWFTGC